MNVQGAAHELLLKQYYISEKLNESERAVGVALASRFCVIGKGPWTARPVISLYILVLASEAGAEGTRFLF